MIKKLSRNFKKSIHNNLLNAKHITKPNKSTTTSQIIRIEQIGYRYKNKISLIIKFSQDYIFISQTKSNGRALEKLKSALQQDADFVL